MVSALEVKLVEDDSVLNLIGSLGPLFIALAAIGAALIAWRSAGTRLAKQLAHDREIRRREHIRDALDSALEIVGETIRAYADFLTDVELTETRRLHLAIDLDDDEADEETTANLREQMIEANLELRGEWGSTFLRLDELGAAITRLKLRFGVGHDIPVAAEELRKRWEMVRDAFHWAIDSNRTNEQIDEANDANERAAEAYATLMTACSAWLAEEID
jgi:hypothetical protein